MKTPHNLAVSRQFNDLEFAAILSSAELRRMQRLVQKSR